MTKEYHYYRVAATSNTGTKLSNLMRDIATSEAAAEELAKEVGAIEYEPTTLAAYGGISYFVFAKHPGKNWSFLRIEDGLRLYVPNSTKPKGMAIREKMNALPIIEPIVMNMILGWEEHQSIFGLVVLPPNFFIKCPAILKNEDLVECTEEEFNNAKDMRMEVNATHAERTTLNTLN